VKQGPVNDEMATLSRAFNRMTEQLARQRDELISAQRRVAWADVARRIAHEIKNPLTPIQLAAERLKKKYSSQLEDGETFDRYLNTIARNVNSIGAMVDEFANFARIPAPIFEKNNMCDILEDSIFAREGIVKEIEFSRSISKKPIMINCDAGQITQVLTNLIKNAEESIIERQAGDKKFVKGIIKVKASQVMNKCGISIKDNGKGFADEIKARITEPYVTTKSKGTGLGLAIVKKIVEDHSGTIEFKNVSGGACVYLSFPLVKL
jgi:two-component system nitrogen regulation sensor histidine kinase NtrY